MNTMSPRQKENVLSRIQRPRIVREIVLAHSQEHGRWTDLQIGAASSGRIGRRWCIDAGGGWSATVSTPFTQPAWNPSEADLRASARLGIPLPEIFDQEVNVTWTGVGKVLSIGSRGDVDRLIGFIPGPWEVAFGLPERPWSPAVARRLARRSV